MMFLGRSHNKMLNSQSYMEYPKIFNNIPPFRLLFDTTGTTYYSVGKYLPRLLNHFTENIYTIKDSFDTANKINQILPDVYNSDKYVFVIIRCSFG